jgi:hypothetical protein
MAGGHGGKTVWEGAGHPVKKIYAARPLYRFAATGLGAAMWFFVRSPIPVKEGVCRTDLKQLFYRMKKDGPVLFGWKHPWDH